MASELGLTPTKLRYLRQAPFLEAVQELERIKAEAKRAYKRLALKYHPDQNQKRPEEATQDFILLGQVLKEIETLQVSPPVDPQPEPRPQAASYFRWQSAGTSRPYNARRVAFMRGDR